MKSIYISRFNILVRTVAMAAALAVLVASGNVQAATSPPNFILILTDDQSWVGSSALMDPENPDTKSNYYQTPNIERLMESGMRFTDGYAPAPLCCPTRRSIQVSQTPARHLMQKDQEAWSARYRKQLNIPRMLKAADPRYKTAHFGKWDHRYDEVTPEEQGYDVSDGYTGNGTGGGKGSGGPAAKEDPKLMDHITQEAINFMRKQAASQIPFFVQMSHYAVHLDIFYRQETLEKTRTWEPGRRHRMPEFAAMTYDVDQTIGQILDEVERLGIADNTYIFYLSDNGGRNTIPRSPEAPLVRNYPLRDGKTSMYEGGLRVPFAVVGPNIQRNSVSRVPVTGLDILPTLAELSGYNKPLPENIDGGSMLSVLNNKGQGEVRRNNPFLIFHHSVSRPAETALRLGDMKLVKTWNENRLELFDLSKDISEANDLSTSMPEQTQKLHTMMINFLESVNADTSVQGTRQRQRPSQGMRDVRSGTTGEMSDTSDPASNPTRLTLDSDSVTDADLEAAKKLSKLERLDVLNGNITDAGLKHVQEMTNLKMLSLKGRKVSDAGLKYIQGLIQLEMLSLERTQVAGPGLQHLRGLSNLRYLNLRNTPVSDTAIDFLSELTTLQTLRLDGSRISETGVNKIREALPDCRISHSTTQRR
ncbi:MAG TPA: sulfatase-like hydrolase/transferase [Sedimentisphaerales bacterium]|nr:sulfatase-like hydrolase/transferase [Sedimentisphaerales bacterium]